MHIDIGLSLIDYLRQIRIHRFNEEATGVGFQTAEGDDFTPFIIFKRPISDDLTACISNGRAAIIVRGWFVPKDVDFDVGMAVGHITAVEPAKITVLTLV